MMRQILCMHSPRGKLGVDRGQYFEDPTTPLTGIEHGNGLLDSKYSGK